MPHRQNLILAALPADILAALEPHLKIVKLPFAQLVASTGGTVTNIYFPHGWSIVAAMHGGRGEQLSDPDLPTGDS